MLTTGHRSPTTGHRGTDHLGRDRADGDGGAFEQGDALAPVVGPGPGRLARRGVPPQRPVGGARRNRADDTHRQRADRHRAFGAAQLFFTDLSPFPVFVGRGVAVVVVDGVALGTGNGTGLTADALPEVP